MDTTDKTVLADLASWVDKGTPCALVTVTGTWGTAPRPAGALLAIAQSGELSGSVSGGCIEDDLVLRLRDSIPERPERVHYGVSAEQAARFGLPCGGQLHLVIEPVVSAQWPRVLLEAIAARQPVTRRLTLATGEVTLESGLTVNEITCDEALMIHPYAPAWRMVITGAGHLSTLTARLARDLGYDVVVCEPRREYREAWRETGIRLTAEMPDDVIRTMVPDNATVVLGLTHDPKLDDLAILEALETDAFYIGALGSSRTSSTRKQRLREHFEATDEQLARVHGPVGINLNSRRAPEIALAILAEITALRNGMSVTCRKVDSRAD